MSDQKRHLQLAEAAPKEWSDEDLLQVGDLARATGKTVRAVHLYESLGLIEPVRRTKGHYRLFAPEALVRVRWVMKMQDLGLSLADIQSLVKERHSSESARRAAAALQATYQSKLDEVRQKIASLRELETELTASLGYLEACTSRCEDAIPIEVCSSCGRHHEDTPRIDLIAGAHLG